MKLAAWILLFSLSLTLGGVQLLLTSGRNIAHARALRIQQRLSGNRASLHWMEMSTQEFRALKTEDIGQGVLEFEIGGVFYDAFEIKPADGKVSLLIKKDHLDSVVARGWKQCKRFLARKGTATSYQLFNFYFPASLQPQFEEWTPVRALFRTFGEMYSYLFSASVHSPPWETA